MPDGLFPKDNPPLFQGPSAQSSSPESVRVFLRLTAAFSVFEKRLKLNRQHVKCDPPFRIRVVSHLQKQQHLIAHRHALAFNFVKQFLITKGKDSGALLGLNIEMNLEVRALGDAPGKFALRDLLILVSVIIQEFLCVEGQLGWPGTSSEDASRDTSRGSHRSRRHAVASAVRPIDRAEAQLASADEEHLRIECPADDRLLRFAAEPDEDRFR